MRELPNTSQAIDNPRTWHYGLVARWCGVHISGGYRWERNLLNARMRSGVEFRWSARRFHQPAVRDDYLNLLRRADVC